MDTNQFLEMQLNLLDEIKNGDSTWNDLTDFRYDFYGNREHKDTVSRGNKLLKEYSEAGWIQKPSTFKSINSKKSVTVKEDGSEISEGKFEVDNIENLRNYDYLLNLHNYPSDLWEIVTAKSSEWDVQNKEDGVRRLYSSKITVKPTNNKIDLNKLEEWFIKFEPKKVDWNNYVIDDNENNCLVLPIADLHWNLLSTAFITGNEYNRKIATDNFYKIINDTCKRIENKKISKIILVLGNDMFNANGIDGETFKGTPQNNETHIFNAYIELFDIIVNGIERLKSVAPIDIIFVTSNHDKEIQFYFMFNLNTHFRLDKNITVDYSPLPRKYYKFGNNLFVFSHDMKINDVANIVLDEGREYLDGVDNIEVILAHLHSETVKQDHNITIRRLSTTSGNSAWSNDKGYGAKKTHQSFIYNDKTGICDCLYVTV